MKTQGNTAQHIIEIALPLMAERGYNAFSYADIADQFAIRKASIHYHFPKKSDLGRAVVASYRTWVGQILTHIERASENAEEQLALYIEQRYKQLKERNFFCLCTLFAAEFQTLPDDVRDEVRSYFQDMEVWFATLLTRGREQQVFGFAGTPEEEAQSMVAAMHGALLMARTYQNPERFRTIAQQVATELQK